ncbi:MAG: ABC transporter permease [Actinobacteria bacterium]|nr:ABC transporter permease [Actinomycetota bacterium]
MKKISQAATSRLKKENDLTGKLIRTYAIWFVLLVLIIVMSFISPVFFSFRNFITVLKNIGPLALIATGLTFVFLGGGFDLSQGAVLLLTSMLIINFNPVTPLTFTGSLLFCLAISIGIGSVNGYFIGMQRMNPFITTLGIRYIIGAFIYIVTSGAVVSATVQSDILEFIGFGTVYRIPIQTIIVATIIIICWFIIRFTTYSRRIKIVGSSIVVSRFSGLQFGKIQMSTYVINALLAGIAGVLIGCNIFHIKPTLIWNYDFDAITACAVGGISLSGGSGTIINTLSGVLLIGFINNSMVLLGLEESWQLIFKGLILLIAIIVDMQIKRRYE